MAGPNDFTAQNIHDTYQRVLQKSSNGQITDGTGSLVPLLEVTASFAISASHEITFEVSSSHAETADFLTSATNTPGFVGSVNIAVSGNAISAGLGEESQETLYAIPGDSATATLGTLVATGSSALTLVGNSATSSTGTLQGTFWSEVDDSNSDISWTEVHKAA